MHHPDIQLNQLRALLAVDSAGSISAAARGLGVTQPVLTRTLRQLEKQLEVPLLERSVRGATLTPYGAALVTRGKRIQQELRWSAEEIAQMRSAAGGSISIACSPVAMQFFVPQAIAQVRRSFPGIQVRATEAVYPDVTAALRERRVDLAVGPVPGAGLGREFRSEHLLTVDLVVSATRGHPAAQARSLALLQNEEWVVMGPPLGPGAVVGKVFAQHGLAIPPSTVFLETVWAALEVMKHTSLLAFLPRPVAQAAASFIDIVPVREKIEPLEIEIFMNAQAVLTPAARAFLSAVRAFAAAWSGPAASVAQGRTSSRRA